MSKPANVHFPRQRLAPWLSCALLACSGPAAGLGGHFAVDDAELVDPGRCELETWYTRFDGDNSEYTVLPTCNPTGLFDVGLGLSRIQEDGDRFTEVALEGKTLVRTLDADGYGAGLAAIAAWNSDSNRVDDAEIYAPVSVPMGERVMTHYNLGWAWSRDERNAVIWGVAAEYWLNGPVSLVAETWGTHRGGTRLQGGLRLEFDRLLIDLAWQRARSSRDDDAVTLGFAVSF